jgi:outer membrane protein OmpA-like peptidoglycan-associated protein
LVHHPPSIITTRGLGETKPVAPNTNPDGSDNPHGRQQNRRVEITVEKT